MPSLADLLQTKIQTGGLTSQAAAEKISVSLPSLRNVLSGKSLPNARTIGKFAEFLGLSVEDLKSQISEAKTSAPREAPPARKGRGKAKARKGGGDVGAALATIQAAIESAQALASDPLAVQIHGLEASKRKLVAALMRGI